MARLTKFAAVEAFVKSFSRNFIHGIGTSSI